jgi:5-methylcytosine-specific restriction endonuclease McrA
MSSTVRGFPEPESMRKGIAGVCKWGCGRPVKKPAIYWHKECFEEYALHTRVAHQKEFLVKRDGKRCAMKGCGACPTKWGRGPVRVMVADHVRRSFRRKAPDMIEWAAILWDRPDKPWAELTEEERQIGAQQDLYYQTDALEVDHVVPLWSVAHLPDDERRWYFGPGNLWLLCPACHKAKTKREAAERAALRRFAAAQPSLPL